MFRFYKIFIIILIGIVFLCLSLSKITVDPKSVKDIIPSSVIDRLKLKCKDIAMNNENKVVTKI